VVFSLRHRYINGILIAGYYRGVNRELLILAESRSTRHSPSIMAARVLKRIRFADDFKLRVHRECRVTPVNRAIECCECHKCRMRRRVAITWRFNLEAAISDCFMLRVSSSRSFHALCDRNVRVNVDFRECKVSSRSIRISKKQQQRSRLR